MNLEDLINELESNISVAERLNPVVSKREIGWHIDHTLRVFIGVAKQVKNSNPADYKKSFNFARAYVFLLGKIPRGKGKAPEAVVSKKDITKEELVDLVAQARTSIEVLNNCAENQFMLHPYFGHLLLKSTKKFLAIHTEHHLKIIREI